jgi:predicted TIM-barrel fold metal-dependent hydrolase
MTLFDAQLLCGTDHWLAHNKPELYHSLTPREAADQMERAAQGEAWRAALFPFPSSPDQAYLTENALVIETAQAEPRFLAVAAINPRRERNLVAVEAAAEQGSIRGLAVWPILCDLDLVDLAREERLWQLAAAHDLPVTVHVGTGAEADLGRAVSRNRYAPLDAVALARAVPHVRFNLSHCLRLSRGALEAVAELDNVWTDTSGLSAIGRWYEAGQEVFPAADALDAGGDPYQIVSRLVASYGLADKIMFASSHPFSAWWGFDVKAEADAYRRLVLSDKAAGDGLYRNACKFFGVPTSDE